MEILLASVLILLSCAWIVTVVSSIVAQFLRKAVTEADEVVVRRIAKAMREVGRPDLAEQLLDKLWEIKRR